MLNTFFKRSPLFTKIVLYVFIITVFVSILGAAIQLHFAYENEKANIEQTLDEIRDVQLDTLTKHLWDMDYQAMNILLRGILGIPDIVYIELRDELNNTYTLGTIPADRKNLIERRFSLSFTRNDRSRLIGEVLFVASTAQIKTKLLKTTTKSLAAQLLTLFLTCCIILVLFGQFFNKHISSIVDYAQNLKIGRLDQKLELLRNKKSSHPDELDLIVNAINSMRESLMAEIEVQKITEKQLKNEKHYLDVIMNSIPGLLFVLDHRLKPIRYNRMFLEKVRLQADAVGGMNIYSWISTSDQQTVQDTLARVLRKGTSESLEVVTINSEGAKVPYLFTVTRLILDNEKMIVGVGSDLSEQKRFEEQLRQAQKMEAIGTLAGGIAHDFNNILSAIFGYINLAQVVSEEDDEIQEYLKEASKASARAKDLVGQILAFSRKKDAEKRPILLKPVVEEALKLLRSSIPTSVEILQNFSSDKLVIADVTGIQQIVMNLCTNGYHAMKNGEGVLEVAISDRVVTHLDQLNLKLQPGAYVQLTVSDNGQGMSDEVKKKIFEPYFTTKEVGTGTGLGLAVVHGVVSQYGGIVEVYSRPGQGTKFTIFFPVAENPEKLLEEKHEQITSDELHGSEKIMVVEDDRSIRNYLRNLLSHYGYEVITFGDPEHCLEHFRQNSDICDLVITDLTMPGLSGQILGQKLMEMRPELPVIITSGFSEKLTRNDYMEMNFAEYFQKPVESLYMLRKIREILDTAKNRSEQN